MGNQQKVVINNKTPPSGPKSNPDTDKQEKKKHSRTRAGCLTCRSRKKKCDESKPRCAGCRRNLLVCEWPPPARSHKVERDHSESPGLVSEEAVSASGWSSPAVLDPALQQWHGSSSAGVSAALEPWEDTGLLCPQPGLAGPWEGEGHVSGTCSSSGSVPASTESGCGGRTCRNTPPPSGPTIKNPPPMSVIHMNHGSNPACALTPQSVTLLSHYLKETASYFAMTPLQQNPFVTVLLPIGYVDDLLMHGILALSGAHLAYKESDNMELANATRMHYSQLISGLRIEFSTLDSDDLEKKERLLRVLIVACHHQATSGDINGVMFNHLRASRQLILSLLNAKPGDAVSRPFNIDALGFSLELYTYLVLVNFLTPYGLMEKRTLPLDPFLLSIEDLSSFPTFGSLYAGSHGLFQLVPEIGTMGSRRLVEESAGFTQPSPSTRRVFDDIYSRIESWTMPAIKKTQSLEDWEHQRQAAETFRQGLHMYLLTALAGSTVTDPAMLECLEDRTHRLFVGIPELIESKFVATVLWPIAIGGSCMVHPEQQQALYHGLAYAGPNRMKVLTIVADTLQLLWADPDPRAFGPYGLYLTMEKHGRCISIA